MAFSRTLTFSSLLLLSVILLHLAEAHQTISIYGTPAPTPLPHTIDCGVACEGRCKLSSRPRLCKRACGSCCAVCKCVPPGTYGNLDSCPCYANLTTRNQIHKCP
ncbi:Snakin-2 protein [Spatholobus suberectus]|nr:Snakin-2 protein [Spatholobus suberectus]